MKINLSITLIACLLTAGCNSVYVKPNTIDPTKTFYAVHAGGYNMRRGVKERMENRGYTVRLGKRKSTRTDADVDLATSIIPYNAAYLVEVSEYERRFSPVWCAFNGFWRWDFNVSISNHKTGEELMTWHGLGCANSSLRKLDRILDKMEIQK